MLLSSLSSLSSFFFLLSPRDYLSSTPPFPHSRSVTFNLGAYASLPFLCAFYLLPHWWLVAFIPAFILWQYQIMVGRSRSSTGPFLDDRGIDMVNSGGLLLIESQPKGGEGHNFTGPGHAGVLYLGEGKYVYTSHMEDVDGSERPIVALGMTISGEGWPLISSESWTPPTPSAAMRTTTPN